jgi:DNA-binding NarL/FixJ family response regulator
MTGALGTEFLKEVHLSHPHIKLLMLSGYMPENAADRVVAQYGVEQVLTKPCPSEVVVAAIREALGLKAS